MDEKVLEEILAEAKANNVKYIICNATSEKDFEKVYQLGNRDPMIIPSYGIHPWYLYQ